MAYVMTKRGNMDNVVTYEFICDTISDMNAIDNTERLLGSVAIVLAGDSGGLEVYIANSSKQWTLMSGIGGGSSSGTAAGLSLYICGVNEYNSTTKVPTIANPDETTLYLVPASEESGNLYDEYVYVDDAWERFGGARVDLSNYARLNDLPTKVSDLANDSGYLTAHQDISGKADKADTILTTTLSRGRAANSTVGTGSVAFGNNVTASRQYSHAEGENTTANGYASHAEGNGSSTAGQFSHAEGLGTQANAGNSHAAGSYTIADGATSYVFGQYNVADSRSAWPTWTPGTAYTAGTKVKRILNNNDETGYLCLEDNNDAEFNGQHWTALSQHMNYVEIVGNGNDTARSNARALDWDGNERLKGDLYIGCNADSTGGTAIGAQITALLTRIAALEAEVAALKVPAAAVTMENGEPITDEQGNYIEYDQPTT